MPGLTATHAQALRDLRDYFREMAARSKRKAEEVQTKGDHEHAYSLAMEANAYEHAMDMTIAYIGKE